MFNNTKYPAKRMNFDMQDVHLDLSIHVTHLTSIFLIKWIHAGEVDGQRFKGSRQTHAALGALHAAASAARTRARGGRGIVALPAHVYSRADRRGCCGAETVDDGLNSRVQSALKQHLKSGFVLSSSAGCKRFCSVSVLRLISSVSTDLPGVCSISVRSAQWSCRLSSSYLLSNTCRRGEEAEPGSLSCILPRPIRGSGVAQRFKCSFRRMSFTQRYCKCVCVCVCVCVAIRNLSISCPDCPHASHPQFTCWTHTLIIPPFSSALKKPRFILPCWRASFISGLHLSLYYLPV